MIIHPPRKRYSFINVNPSWKEEGCKFQSIDFKYLTSFVEFRNNITLYFKFPFDSEETFIIAYPVVIFKLMEDIHSSIWISFIQRNINIWAKYKEKVKLYKSKYSNKEINTIFLSQSEEENID